MLRTLAQPDGSCLTALRAAPLAPVAVPPARPQNGTRRAPLGWRLRQAVKLCTPGRFPRIRSLSPVALFAWAVAVAAWPLTADVLVPVLARIARACGLCVGYCELRLRVLHRDAAGELVAVTEYGLASRKLITDDGVAYLAADMAGGGSDINLFKFHGAGTGTTNESASQTALVTELTTEYQTNSTRPTGSQSSSTNSYVTIGTLTPDSGGTLAITEHGLFSASSSGTMWDRSKFSAVNLDSSAGDSLQFTHTTTFPSGG